MGTDLNTVSDRVALIDDQSIHRYGDVDHSYRATTAGGKDFIAPAPVGTCSANSPIDEGKRLASRSLAKRWKVLHGPLTGSTQ